MNSADFEDTYSLGLLEPLGSLELLVLSVGDERE